MTTLNEELEMVRRLAIIGLFSDDDLMDLFVLKGGNALEIAYKVHSRASMDIDVSLESDFEELGFTIEEVETKIMKSMKGAFEDSGYIVFDFKMSKRPLKLAPELDKKWGGYAVEFKVIREEQAAKAGHELEKMRKISLAVAGTKKNMKIDISKYEYVSPATEAEIDDYVVRVYTPRMIVMEKLRAICQQLPEYQAIMRSSVSPRPRDFYDIYVICTTMDEHLDLSEAENWEMLQNFFSIKEVPLSFLLQIEEQQTRDFHEQEFSSVRDTVHQKEELQDFDFYYNFVVQLIAPIKAQLKSSR